MMNHDAVLEVTEDEEGRLSGLLLRTTIIYRST